jgi:hypothetical protein
LLTNLRLTRLRLFYLSPSSIQDGLSCIETEEYLRILIFCPQFGIFPYFPILIRFNMGGGADIWLVPPTCAHAGLHSIPLQSSF